MDAVDAVEGNLVVVYREVSREDGFVVTAFVTARPQRLEERLVWPPQQK